MLTIIDYNLGGVTKVADVLSGSGINFKITKNENDIISSERIILPGNEEAFTAVKKLHLLNLFTVLRIVKKPVLGIGLGMQLLSEYSKEGDVACLGKFPGIVNKFNMDGSIVPFKGNFKVKVIKESTLFNGMEENAEFFFCNSYYLAESEYTIATSINGIPFSASIQKDNFYGVQFHPEESGDSGLQLLQNFSVI